MVPIKELFIILISLCWTGSTLLGQTLDPDNPKYIFAFKVYQEIAQTAGGNAPIPAFEMNALSHTKNGAGFIHKPTPRIYLDEKLFDLCKEFKKQQADALAVILGHEIAHFFRLHEKKSSFAKESSVNDTSIESEADYYGTLYGIMSGFQTVKLLPQVLNVVYEAYELPDELAGYKSKSERFKSVEAHIQKLEKFEKVFHMGTFLFLQKEFEGALGCFQYIQNEFPSREIFNNIGLCYLSLAMPYAKSSDQYYTFPFELDTYTRLRLLQSRAALGEATRQKNLDELLDQAQVALENAVEKDPTYIAANLNLATVLILKDNPYAAIGMLTTLQKQTKLPPNAYSLLGIAHAKLESNEKALSNFQKAVQLKAPNAAYNLELYQQKESIRQSLKDQVVQLQGDIYNWVLSWWEKEQTCTLPGKEKRIGTVSFLDLLDIPGQHTFQVPTKYPAIKIGTLETPEVSGYAIQLGKKEGDVAFSILSTPSNYPLPNAKGIRIGSTLDAVQKIYCEPDYWVPEALGRSFLIYEELQLIFHLKENKVIGWTLYRKSI